MTSTVSSGNYLIAFYSGNRKTGSLAVVRAVGGKTSVEPVAGEPESDAVHKPVFLGLTSAGEAVLMDPESKAIVHRPSFPADAFPAHCYSEPDSNRDWFLNDGDKETGNDTLNCGDEGSSVTVIENSGSADARHLKTVCVGRGHHQAAFTRPSEAAPQVPRRAYISNLVDGTLSVIGDDPEDAATYLQLIDTINLCEPDKEEGGAMAVPNKAFPHGLAYSSATGKLYNLNNGYGSVAVIDPLTNTIEDRLSFKGHSNLFPAPDGRHLIGRGADRKSDPEHVIAQVSVLDSVTQQVTAQTTLPDLYMSKYFFNPEGTKLYLTTGSSGNDQQKANVKDDAVLIFDMTALPELKLVKELRLGAPSGTLAFHQEGGRTTRVFASNADQGQLTVIDGQTDEVLEALDVGESKPHSRIWMLGE